jgi:hypothetical protein
LDHVSPVKHPTTNVATRIAGAASILRRGTRVVGAVFFVYAADGTASIGSATPNATPEASHEGDVAFTLDEIEGGESRAETTAADASEDASGEETRGSGEETVGAAEHAASSGESPGSRGPGGIALFALGGGTLLVANGLLARWIVG